MIIKTIIQTSYKGMYKITAQIPENNSTTTFYARKEYAPEFDFDFMSAEDYFDQNQTNTLLDAGLAAAVELKALEYIARAEQSRFGLSRKLIEKKYDKKYINMALDYLESVNFLSDQRFSRAWLNGRKINHFEGKSKLLAELQSRGISKENALTALEEFFNDNDEYEICKKAYQKFTRKGKHEDKLINAMLQAGFSYSMIKKAACDIAEENQD